jgi:hypothetical protein
MCGRTSLNRGSALPLELSLLVFALHLESFVDTAIPTNCPDLPVGEGGDIDEIRGPILHRIVRRTLVPAIRPSTHRRVVIPDINPAVRVLGHNQGNGIPPIGFLRRDGAARKSFPRDGLQRKQRTTGCNRNCNCTGLRLFELKRSGTIAVTHLDLGRRTLDDSTLARARARRILIEINHLCRQAWQAR